MSVMPSRIPRDQNQDFSDIVGDYRDLGQLETDVTAMGNDLGGEFIGLSKAWLPITGAEH